MLGLDYGGNYHKPQYLQTQWPWSAISRVDFATRKKNIKDELRSSRRRERNDLGWAKTSRETVKAYELTCIQISR